MAPCHHSQEALDDRFVTVHLAFMGDLASAEMDFERGAVLPPPLNFQEMCAILCGGVAY